MKSRVLRRVKLAPLISAEQFLPFCRTIFYGYGHTVYVETIKLNHTSAQLTGTRVIPEVRFVGARAPVTHDDSCGRYRGRTALRRLVTVTHGRSTTRPARGPPRTSVHHFHSSWHVEVFNHGLSSSNNSHARVQPLRLGYTSVLLHIVATREKENTLVQSVWTSSKRDVVIYKREPSPRDLRIKFYSLFSLVV